MLTPAEAEQQIARHLPSLPIESLPLAQCGGGVLRENIYAERDAPPFDRVAMDGIAVASATVRAGARRLRVEAMQAAGDSPLTLDSPGACIEVMTGAVLPGGCDAVIPVEQITVAAGEARLGAQADVEPWQHVHRRGSDSRQGALLLAAGGRLGAPEIAIVASAGMARVRVSSQPTIAVISTGNELVEPGEPILAHQVRRSNAYGIVAALRCHGFQRIADDHLRDDRELLRARLKFHLDTHDVLILSGGVSAGRLDLVPETLAALGVREVFHRVAQRPGRPLWFGVAGSGSTVFALPGNPVSTLVCLTRYVVPALYAAMGAAAAARERIALGGPIEIASKLACFVPARVDIDEWGRPWATPCPTNGSGDFTALAGTDGFVELPPGPNTFPRGFVTGLYRW
ncbi:MAG TPA: molybdopterin molybdotransferase MoeA [Steroidobacteraceae bacterium]|nr:molybdopterin molybdotransferase MoeA [Steroidobacteraceae bacterium]